MSREPGVAATRLRGDPESLLAWASAVDADEASRWLGLAAPCLRVGGVFWVPDAWTGGTPSGKVHPAMIVQAVPALEPPELAFRRPIRISPRLSWKARFGPPPSTGGECERWRREMNWMFTPAGVMDAFDRDGLFEIKPLRLVQLGLLTRAEFIGWLPKPYAELLAACATGARLPTPYPPVDE